MSQLHCMFGVQRVGSQCQRQRAISQLTMPTETVLRSSTTPTKWIDSFRTPRHNKHPPANCHIPDSGSQSAWQFRQSFHTADPLRCQDNAAAWYTYSRQGRINDCVNSVWLRDTHLSQHMLSTMHSRVVHTTAWW